jgi:hypothetical protein
MVGTLLPPQFLLNQRLPLCADDLIDGDGFVLGRAVHFLQNKAKEGRIKVPELTGSAFAVVVFEHDLISGSIKAHVFVPEQKIITIGAQQQDLRPESDFSKRGRSRSIFPPDLEDYLKFPAFRIA